MKTLDKKESHKISGGYCNSMKMIGDIIIFTLAYDGNDNFEFNGLNFKIGAKGMNQGEIYNGYQVVFSPKDIRGVTTFVLTPVTQSFL